MLQVLLQTVEICQGLMDALGQKHPLALYMVENLIHVTEQSLVSRDGNHHIV